MSKRTKALVDSFELIKYDCPGRRNYYSIYAWLSRADMKRATFSVSWNSKDIIDNNMLAYQLRALALKLDTANRKRNIWK